METHMIVRLVLGLLITAVALAVAGRRVFFLYRMIAAGQPSPGRLDGWPKRLVGQVVEVFGQARLLKWNVPGIAHFFVFWGFLILTFTIIEAFGALFDVDFHIPLIGRSPVLGFLEDFFGVAVLLGLLAFASILLRSEPKQIGRDSRFYGSNFWQAYFVEALALLEGSAILFVRAAEWRLDEEAGRAHYPFSSWLGDLLYPSSVTSLENLIYVIATFKIALAMIWLMVIARNITMGIAWHRFTAWFNIWFKREADGTTALGAMKPLTSEGRAITLDDIDDLDEDSVLGAGKVEDFSWKGILDFTTCTECGRCQSQCPAWNTEKPLSPKLLITSLRDHAYAKHDDAESHRDFDLVSPHGGYSREGQEGHMAWEEELYFQMCWRWRNLPKPLLAAAQGKTIAGGLIRCCAARPGSVVTFPCTIRCAGRMRPG